MAHEAPHRQAGRSVMMMMMWSSWLSSASSSCRLFVQAGVCVDDGEEEEEEDLESFLQHDVPEDLLCPVSLALLTDPVVASDGITYQRDCLLQCIDWARRRGE